jgi:hypothetical protein
VAAKERGKQEDEEIACSAEATEAAAGGGTTLEGDAKAAKAAGTPLEGGGEGNAEAAGTPLEGGGEGGGREGGGREGGAEAAETQKKRNEKTIEMQQQEWIASSLEKRAENSKFAAAKKRYAKRKVVASDKGAGVDSTSNVLMPEPVQPLVPLV